jgi:hypothetical protein
LRPLILEDGFFEWTSAIFFLLASCLFLLSFFKSKDNSVRGLKRYAWAYLGVALFFFVAFGEEISWGQRIFGIETPEIIAGVNKQREMNIHNLKWVFGNSGFAAMFSSKRIFIYVCLLFLLIAPALKKNKEFMLKMERWRIPVAPMFFGVLFLANAIFSKILRYGWFKDSEEHIHALTEIMEANFAIIVFVASLFLFLHGVHHKTVEHNLSTGYSKK